MYSKNYDVIVGKSAAVKTLIDQVSRLKNKNVTVLVTGESGTGKELVARMIHRQEGQLSRPFVPVNCGGIPDSLMESILFGSEKGAFSGAFTNQIGKFELAHNGDIFLDEVGTLPLGLQTKLLRVLETKEVDRVGGKFPQRSNFRVIAATNEDLGQRVLDGKFRADLWYRLNVYHIHLVPLRERREDIAELVTFFLNRSRASIQVGADVIAAMSSYDWPGNIRELENVVMNMVLLNKRTIQLDDIPHQIWKRKAIIAVNAESVLDYDHMIQKIEKGFIVKSLSDNAWSKTKTAEVLGMSRSTLYKKMDQLGIQL